VTLTTMQQVWCDGCVPGECVYGPCAKPAPDAVGTAAKLGMQQVGNGLTSNYPPPTQGRAPMDAWRIDNLEEIMLHLAHFENVKISISLSPGSNEPWRIRYNDYGAEVCGRDLRDALDYSITMLRDTVAQYEGGDEEEDDEDYEEDSEPF